MFVIDFKEETIKEMNEMQICSFVNHLIKDKNADLIGKRYLFVPDEDAAYFVVNQMMEKIKNEIRH
jgi:hypothetical protein